MRFILRNDIERWAERFDSKGNLPSLVSRLVRETTRRDTLTEFPSGSAVFIGSWDGIVNCSIDTAYVPKGISLWEFGTEADNKGKADDDYDKRTSDPLGYNPSECTFVFITPRFWKHKDKWRTSKLAEGKWKDIKVYDSSVIEEWLDLAQITSRWFSVFVKTYPYDGILTVERFWLEWSKGPGLELPPMVVTAGREFQVEQLRAFLNSTPGIKAIRAPSKDEATAFIIASAMQFEHHANDDFFSRSLIVDTAANFRGISINKNSLNLISRIEETNILYGGVSDGHHVLVPLGPDDTFNQDVITLPTVDREGLKEALMSMGMSEDDARKYSRESGRNVTILKRLLNFQQDKLTWALSENARDIIPALLVGRWDESKSADRIIVEQLAEMPYDDYVSILTKWLSYETPPILKIGSTWRLTSPMDAWANLSPFLVKKDLGLLSKVFDTAFKNGNPVLGQDSSAPFPSYFNRDKKFSGWIREGIIQSLILIGLYGKNLKFFNLDDPQVWVDERIGTLLDYATKELWISLNDEMPLIAEASPSIFLAAARSALEREDKPIMAMFVEEESFLAPTGYHTGLLWALEALAWLPEYLYDVSLILCQLSAFDPGGKLSNRPLNSLKEIFKSWHYQTLATFDQRFDVLTQLAPKQNNIVWKVLLSMLPEVHGVGQYTHKMRWRMFDKKTEGNYTSQEVYATHTKALDLLISIYDNQEDKLAELLNASTKLHNQDRDKVLLFVEAQIPLIVQTSYASWNILRRILSRHRSETKAGWALSESELKKYEVLYEMLSPSDEVTKYFWLFENAWPDMPSGFIDDDGNFDLRHEQRQQKLGELRKKALQSIVKQIGFSKVVELSNRFADGFFIGDTLGQLAIAESELMELLSNLDKPSINERFFQGFLSRISCTLGISWTFETYKKLKASGFSATGLAQFLIPVSQSSELWNFINAVSKDVRANYWLAITPHFYNLKPDEKVTGISTLLEYGRFFSAIDIASHLTEELPTDLIAELLERAVIEKANESIRIRDYEIERLFEVLDKRNDIKKESLIRLEWFYIPVLASYGSIRNPKLLHEELSTNPHFFVDVLKLIYKPQNITKSEEVFLREDEELIKQKALQAYYLINSWKTIPGVKEGGAIDAVFLNKWITDARELAEKEERIEVADMHIGQVLAQYPETQISWPPEEIANVIESINTKSLKSNFSSAIFNKHGASTRGVFDGGDIERAHAHRYSAMAEYHKERHPNLAAIFHELAKGYLQDARRMDECAERDKLDF
jgi:hypothetical protein